MGNDLGAQVKHRLADNLQPVAQKKMDTCK